MNLQKIRFDRGSSQKSWAAVSMADTYTYIHTLTHTYIHTQTHTHTHTN